MDKKLNGKINITEKTTDKRLKNLILWKKGDPSPNPGGKPVGTRNYDTIRREALIELGKKNNKTPEEIENMLIGMGLSEALGGDYRYYKDDLDRKYGQAIAKTDLTSGGEKIEGLIILPNKNVGNTKEHKSSLATTREASDSISKN